MSDGFAVLIVALTVATAFGLWRRRVDGRMRGVSPREVEVAAPPGSPDASHAGQSSRLSAEDIGAALGSRATFVQFSSAFCQPCRATRQVVGEVSGMVPGVVHVEMDAEHHLDLVRRLHVMRTPTVFVLDETGTIRKRASGTPRKADLIAALGEFVAP